MTAAAINKELDHLEARRQKVNEEIVRRGLSVQAEAPPHPLIARIDVINERYRDLRNEIGARYGPGAPSRLPEEKCFGPRKGWRT